MGLRLHNVLEDEVLQIIDSFIFKNMDICKCSVCRLDIAALSLNNLKPEYVVSSKGELYIKLNNMSKQRNADLLTTITRAAEVVSKNPRHQE